MKPSASQGAKLAKPPLMRVFAAQCVLLLLAAITLLWVDGVAAYSALLGGLISIGPNVYFARWAFRFSGAQAAVEVARSFYRGEAGKFLLTACMFAGVFALVEPINAMVLFLAYIVLTVLNWILSVRMLQK